MKFCLGHPPLNPITNKARALPIINPIDRHGRVFFFSWMGFMLSFMAWYAFPPLLAKTIRADLHLTREQVLNSNIVALCAGMLMRFCVGPLCDQFGPRKVMVGILWTAAIPCGLAGTISNVTGLYLIRFFVGIAGAAFVPCQVWCTGWFDKQVVGTANAFAAGWGNAGAGVTYFVMPAVFDSLFHHMGYTAHVAWRIAFIVPTILLIVCGIGALLLCDDTPKGKWADRHLLAAAEAQAAVKSVDESESDADLDEKALDKKGSDTGSAHVVPANDVEAGEAANPETTPKIEIVAKPSFRVAAKALFSPQLLMLAAPYFCSFGGELALNSILSAWYLQHQPQWGQTLAGRWAAMFGLLNVITRPAGGLIADYIYEMIGQKGYRGVQAKKVWYGSLVAMQGVFCLWVGLVNSDSPATLIGGIAGIAIFMDAANGAAYALVPHVHPHANGLLSGAVGGSGNFGGIIFSIIYRFTSYATGTWILGIFAIVIGVAINLVHPIPKSQRKAGGYMST